ncbi:MAG: glycosyltransferase [Candidatus Gygaella obscura]|nr:glycosyltransferase [Candidatus Gygaella obscura]
MIESNKQNKSITVVIAVKQFNDNLKRCIENCLEQDYPNFDILVFPDEDFQYDNDKVKIITTGNKTPGVKRNLALVHSNADIFAFIDDDAYPEENWLKSAVINFADENIAAVGGPSITPEEDSLLQKTSGLIYESNLVSGPYVYRYLPTKRQFVDDYPSCNFIVRRSVFAQINGFDEKYWPGEDTVFCLNLTKKLNKKIVYDPKVLVFHHRRPVFKSHLRQIANYALHRGFFVKKFPQTSLRVGYFVPSVFLIFLVLGPLVNVNLYIFTLMLYLLLVFSNVFLVFKHSKTSQYMLIPLMFFGIIRTHVSYGFYFLKGLTVKKLQQ